MCLSLESYQSSPSSSRTPNSPQLPSTAILGVAQKTTAQCAARLGSCWAGGAAVVASCTRTVFERDVVCIACGRNEAFVRTPSAIASTLPSLLTSSLALSAMDLQPGDDQMANAPRSRPAPVSFSSTSAVCPSAVSSLPMGRIIVRTHGGRVRVA